MTRPSVLLSRSRIGKAAPKPKAKSGVLVRGKTAPEKFGETPFGRRMHWVQALYEEPRAHDRYSTSGQTRGPSVKRHAAATA